MGYVRGGGERESGKKHFKNLLLPCLCIRRGEEHAQCRLKWHRVMLFSFFSFFLKEMNLEITQKWVMTVALLFTMLMKQRFCVVSFVKINKTDLSILIFSKLGLFEALSLQQFSSTMN